MREWQRRRFHCHERSFVCTVQPDGDDDSDNDGNALTCTRGRDRAGRRCGIERASADV